VTAWGSQVSRVGVERLATAGAIVLGIDHDQVAVPTGQGIAQVVEIRFVKESIGLAVWSALETRAGSEALSADAL
jgi:hypothetical protein